MYPLDVALPGGAGFAVANTEDEHRILSELGYQPALEKQEEAKPSEPVKRGPGRPRKNQ